MFFQFKAKGILIPVYALVPLVVFLILTKTVDSYLLDDRLYKKAYELVASLAVITSGIWTFYTANDYFIDDEGEKHYMYFDNQFMFIKMEIWAYIFWIFGGLGFLGSVVELIQILLRHTS